MFVAITVAASTKCRLSIIVLRPLEGVEIDGLVVIRAVASIGFPWRATAYEVHRPRSGNSSAKGHIKEDMRFAAPSPSFLGS